MRINTSLQCLIPFLPFYYHPRLRLRSLVQLPHVGSPGCPPLRDQYIQQVLFRRSRGVFQRSRGSSRHWWWYNHHLTQQPQQLWAVLSEALGVLADRTNRREVCVFLPSALRLLAMADSEKVVAGAATRGGSTVAIVTGNSGQQQQ